MLSEKKCVLCKHFIFDFSFEHKCKAYPNGIPDKIFNEDTNSVECNNPDFHFELDTK